MNREWSSFGLKMEGWLLAQRARVASIEAEVQGMVAQNSYRIACNEPIKYGDEAFQEKADNLLSINKEIIEQIGGPNG